MNNQIFKLFNSTDIKNIDLDYLERISSKKNIEEKDNNGINALILFIKTYYLENENYNKYYDILNILSTKTTIESIDINGNNALIYFIHKNIVNNNQNIYKLLKLLINENTIENINLHKNNALLYYLKLIKIKNNSFIEYDINIICMLCNDKIIKYTDNEKNTPLEIYIKNCKYYNININEEIVRILSGNEKNYFNNILRIFNDEKYNIIFNIFNPFELLKYGINNRCLLMYDNALNYILNLLLINKKFVLFDKLFDMYYKDIDIYKVNIYIFHILAKNKQYKLLLKLLFIYKEKVNYNLLNSKKNTFLNIILNSKNKNNEKYYDLIVNHFHEYINYDLLSFRVKKYKSIYINILINNFTFINNYIKKNKDFNLKKYIEHKSFSVLLLYEDFCNVKVNITVKNIKNINDFILYYSMYGIKLYDKNNNNINLLITKVLDKYDYENKYDLPVCISCNKNKIQNFKSCNHCFCNSCNNKFYHCILCNNI